QAAGNELLAANAAWVSRELPLQPEFRKVAELYMQATVKPVDFGDIQGTVNEINEWAAKKSRNRIKDAVDADFVAGSNPCILTNVVYLLGGWETKCDRENTKPRGLRLASGQSVRVPTMAGVLEARAGLDEETGTTTGELFYGKKKTSMVILLP